MKTDNGSRADIIVKMKDLKLSGMIESYDEIIANTARIKGTVNHALYELLKAESKKRTILYSVKQGGNLYKISDLFDVTVESIKEINNFQASDLMPGQIIKIAIRAF